MHGLQGGEVGPALASVVLGSLEARGGLVGSQSPAAGGVVAPAEGLELRARERGPVEPAHGFTGARGATWPASEFRPSIHARCCSGVLRAKCRLMSSS